MRHFKVRNPVVYPLALGRKHDRGTPTDLPTIAMLPSADHPLEKVGQNIIHRINANVVFHHEDEDGNTRLLTRIGYE